MNQKKWEKLLKKTAKLIYDGKFKPESLNIDMVQAHANELYKGVLEGYSIESSNIGAEDEKILQALKENVFVFSGFKNYQELKEISSLILDSSNKVRAFKDFYNDVKAVDKTYNQLYLEAEYQHAVSTSTSIAQWQRIQEDKQDAPYLEYVAVMDDRTRDAHRSLDGTIRKVDDPFWDKYYPPNGWRCRCDVVQHVDATETPADKINYPDTPLQDMFSNNAGKEKVVFPKSHPYYKVSKSTALSIVENVTSIIKTTEARKDKSAAIKQELKKTYDLPYSKQFNSVYKHKSGGEVKEHLLVDKKHTEYEGNLAIAKVLAKSKYKVELLPKIYKLDIEFRKKIMPNAPAPKNPDYKINGVEHELETANKCTKPDINNKIKAGAVQANNVVIKLMKDASSLSLEDIATNKFKYSKNLESIIFITNNNKILVFKK